MLFGTPTTLNIRKAKAITEKFFKKDLNLSNVDSKINGNGIQICASDVTIFDYEVLYLGVCCFESGYMSFAIDFDSPLTAPTQELYDALNAFNKASAGWKAYFDEDSINFDYEVDTVNNDTYEDNIRGALHRILSDDTKKLFQPIFKYMIKAE